MNLSNAIQHACDALDLHLRNVPRLALPPLPVSAEAFIALALAKRERTAVLWIVQRPEDIDRALRDLHTLAPSHDTSMMAFPPVSLRAGKGDADDLDAVGTRMNTLTRLAEMPEDSVPTVVTCIDALLQAVVSPAALGAQIRRVELNRPLDAAAFCDWLQSVGYHFESEVLDKGQASRKGGILDLWSPDSPWPVRIELFGDCVESLRRFDPRDQRSVERTVSALISPAAEVEDAPGHTGPACLLDHIRPALAVLWNDAGTLRSQAEQAAGEAIPRAFAFNDILQKLARRAPPAWQIETGAENAGNGFAPISITPLVNAVTLPATAGSGLLEQARQRLLNDLLDRAARLDHVLVFFDTEGSREHFQNHLLHEPAPGLTLHVGRLSEGFCAESMGLTLVAESDLYGHRKLLQRFKTGSGERGRAQRFAGSRISDFTDMEEGDLVVHADHGIGRYLGVQRITFQNQHQDVLAIEYAEGAKLYVPMHHAHLLSRYVGMAGRTATLHRLGGGRWTREKGAAQTAVLDLAAQLLDVQARRNLLQGHAFPPDTPLQHEFENAFAFEETPDQVQVIREVRADMESTRPMDRLICGDAGYGKTEVAMRAAFKAVQDHRQVAVLVPTTILAQQHYQTFSERMTGFDVRIRSISRFQSPAQRRGILQSLENGETDIIIGTHALVQPGIRFRNLGLVIIDEEQRFGVVHKERLKTIRHLVDVLTLSATPIPRTLYLSMTGARDMSLLRTPPRERVPIETIMATGSEEVVRTAIRRELSRGGQVYYLHNRIVSIHRLRERTAALVPEARIEIAHGQMKSAELSAVMRRFIAGETDVLLCTTIIESGVDIPHANTILIDRADRFGIADLYQLRGRVGRAGRKAYAWMLLPTHGIVDADARNRIQAVRSHSDLGAGFNLAIRDMEIRGAGNILGAAQSGHISSIGFGLYCRLLQRAVARMKGEPAPPVTDTEIRLDFIHAEDAMLPHAYIEDERLRVAIYRRISEASANADLNALQQEMTDRFGPVPPPAQRLLSIAGLRLTAAALELEGLEVRERKVMLKHNGDYLTHNNRFPVLETETPDSRLAELLGLLHAHRERLHQQMPETERKTQL